MKIGELARETGLAPSRIRYYESLGLIGAVERRLNGYRSYPRETAQLLRIITGTQRAGFSLDEIRSLLPQKSGAGWDRPKLLTGLKQKLADLAALQASLAATQADLEFLIARIESSPPDGDCFDNAQAVLDDVSQRQPAISNA
ncbi:MAG: MerR family transcriptional regulator [Caulobacter sp.]|nr:MerR family transcriptional regulator [Caulobacter sp.]